jgi:putative transposase
MPSSSRIDSVEAVLQRRVRSTTGLEKVGLQATYSSLHPRAREGVYTMSTGGHSPTEVSDAQWEALQLLLPQPTWHPGGPGRQPLDRRRVLHGIVYVTKPGGPWRLLPTNSGHAPTLYGSCRRWRQAGVWGRVMAPLRQWARPSPGRLPAPSACCADTQRSKTATHGEEVGCDGHKQSKGRNRHRVVDPLGLRVAVVGTAATRDDRLGLATRGQRDVAPGVTRLRNIWVDGGEEAQGRCGWVRGLQQPHKMKLEVVEHTGKGFHVVKRRWKVERTVGWLGNDRRHSRDDAG